MKSFKNHLQEKLSNKDFRNAYYQELRLTEIAIQIAKSREG